MAIIAMLICMGSIHAQPGVGIGTNGPDAHSILDIVSTDRGIFHSEDDNGTARCEFNLSPALMAQMRACSFSILLNQSLIIGDGTQWIPFPGDDDYDWFEQATPDASPDNINDDIYTNGRVGIGVYPLESFHIDDENSSIQSIRVEDLAQSGDAYNPSTASISQANRATVFVDKTTGTFYSEDADRAFWRLDGNAGVVNAGYNIDCPNLISGSMNGSGYEYIGTNDATDFIVATDDTERMRYSEGWSNGGVRQRYHGTCLITNGMRSGISYYRCSFILCHR